VLVSGCRGSTRGRRLRGKAWECSPSAGGARSVGPDNPTLLGRCDSAVGARGNRAVIGTGGAERGSRAQPAGEACLTPDDWPRSGGPSPIAGCAPGLPFRRPRAWPAHRSEHGRRTRARVDGDPLSGGLPRDQAANALPTRQRRPPTRLPSGSCVRVKKADLDAFLEACRIQPGELDHLCGPDAGLEQEPEDDDD